MLQGRGKAFGCGWAAGEAGQADLKGGVSASRFDGHLPWCAAPSRLFARLLSVVFTKDKDRQQQGNIFDHGAEIVAKINACACEK